MSRELSCLEEVINSGMPNSRLTLTGTGPNTVRMAWDHRVEVGGMREKKAKQQVPLMGKLFGLVFLSLCWTFLNKWRASLSSNCFINCKKQPTNQQKSL